MQQRSPQRSPRASPPGHTCPEVLVTVTVTTDVQDVALPSLSPVWLSTDTPPRPLLPPGSSHSLRNPDP